MYPIIQSPHEILRTVTQTVDLNLPDLPKIIEEMVLTLRLQKNPEGVGLAANQIGLPYRLFVARFSISRQEPIHVFINPEVINHSKEFQEPDKKSPLEGCLSLPKYYGRVKRWQQIKLKYQTLNLRHSGDPASAGDSRINQTDSGRGQNDEVIETFEGFPAVVIQHEMDHLNGKIFVEKILEQKGRLYKTAGKDENNKEIWEEVAL